MKLKIGFIGAGNMASAIIAGLISAGLSAKRIWVSDPNEEKLIDLQERFKVNYTNDNNELLAHVECVVLAVKPQVMPRVCQNLSLQDITDKPFFLSVAAGVTIQSLQDWLQEEVVIIRSMPNTPALVRAGITALYAHGEVESKFLKAADKIMQAVGSTVWVDTEDQLNIVTAVSGSGPAYFFLLMQALQESAEDLGLSDKVAVKLAKETAFGSAKLANEIPVGFIKLRQRVTSPGGTTEAAVKTLEKLNFVDNIKEAVQAAYLRSKELGN